MSLTLVWQKTACIGKGSKKHTQGICNSYTKAAFFLKRSCKWTAQSGISIYLTFLLRIDWMTRFQRFVGKKSIAIDYKLPQDFATTQLQAGLHMSVTLLSISKQVACQRKDGWELTMADRSPSEGLQPTSKNYSLYFRSATKKIDKYCTQIGAVWKNRELKWSKPLKDKNGRLIGYWWLLEKQTRTRYVQSNKAKWQRVFIDACSIYEQRI